jgi:hypothetical protein
MAGVIALLIIVILLSWAVYIVNWAGKHCDELGVTFKDFYFGTKKYGDALSKRKQQTDKT